MKHRVGCAVRTTDMLEMVRIADPTCGKGVQLMPNDKLIPHMRLPVLAARLLLCGCVVLAAVSCSCGESASAPTATNGKNDAPKLAGRPLQISTSRYVIFAHSHELAAGLASWLDSEFVEFEGVYQVGPNVPVAIAAIEPGEETAPYVKEWRRAFVSRVRPVIFAAKSGPHRYDQGRPYCMSPPEPYFRESFLMPTDAAVQLGLVDAGTVQAPSVCFLTTDEHHEEAFQLDLQVMERTMVREPDSWILRLIDQEAFRQNHTLDRQLMHLQRREVLWQSLIDASFSDREKIMQLKHELVGQIDSEFGKIFLSRRTD